MTADNRTGIALLLIPAMAAAMAFVQPAHAQAEPGVDLGVTEVDAVEVRASPLEQGRPYAAPRPPQALSSADRVSYTTAFDALRRGALDEARESARRAQDRVLLGHVEFERLFDRRHTASYDELAAWLESYADLDEAPRVYALAMRRRPDGAPEPRRPVGSLLARTWEAVQAATGLGGSVPEPLHPRAARIALNNEDFDTAWTLGSTQGDWWTAGLAAWRQNDPARAFGAFERVALDPMEDPWVRSGAAFWTARAAQAMGRLDRVAEFQHLAARWPATFYGQIAQRQLGQEPVIHNLGPRPYEAVVANPPAPAEPPVASQDELSVFLRDNARARRTVAWHEVGRRDTARDELRAGLRSAEHDEERRLWRGLAQALGPRYLPSGAVSRIDAIHYPVPDLEPEGGFTIERALVYAIARKETGFEQQARSGAGAYGMMQVMPTTAAEMTGDRGFITDPQRLWVPAVNMRLGQQYVNRMLQMNAFRGDILRAVASYNAGPGPMLAALRKLGPDADPLLLIETIDVPQARQYVEEVVAAYWIYQRLFGGPLNTLDALASGASLVPISLDYVPPPPVQVAQATTEATAAP
jgi:soluble lytic murein transglycosylase